MSARRFYPRPGTIRAAVRDIVARCGGFATSPRIGREIERAPYNVSDLLARLESKGLIQRMGTLGGAIRWGLTEKARIAREGAVAR